ncbi:MAG: ribonuclease H-like domain-containing protein [Chloroflexi bacterium]|nr:ribonuclease H-like domain-containing protein [Chloroflexota bacterium]
MTDPTVSSERETGAAMAAPVDALLFGHDPTPGIVSVFADRQGNAIVWRRLDGLVTEERVRFPNWLLVSDQRLLEGLGATRMETSPLDPGLTEPPGGLAWLELQGPGAYRYLVVTDRLAEVDLALRDRHRELSAARASDLAPLRDVVYVRSAAEQYLSWSGRTYFKGLTYDDIHRLQFDLETTGLDNRRDRIFMVSLRDNHGFTEVLDVGGTLDNESERRLLERFVALMRERDPDVLENHNVFDFDIPFLIRRAAALKVPLGLGRDGSTFAAIPDSLKVGERSESFTRYALAGREIVDTLHAVKRFSAINRDLRYRGLKQAAEYFGFKRNDREYVPGAEIWPTFQTDPERVRRYASHDVEEVDDLSRLLMGASFALASMVPRPYERVATSGTAQGLIEPLLVRAYLQAGHALPKGSAAGAAYAGGHTELFASGLARNVVKADIASLYPSLMLAYRIAPASDSAGVFLKLLEQLTRLRLRHKRHARQSPPGQEQAFHNALQGAMKVLINSFYGTLGTSFALFGDLHAASEVTRRGRDVLTLVLAELQRRGLSLLEADTDGVLFSVPDGWAEADEHVLVDEISAALPDGITIEHDGRYQRMYSYKEKNYILLDYGGRVRIVGSAFRSSKLEPYGERFVERAAEPVLRGDEARVRELFLEVVEQLRARALPARDLSTRITLTKTVEQYRKANRREEQYEVLLAAGRQEWQVNERVTYYQGSDKKKKLLEDELATDYDPEHYVKRLRKTYCERFSRAFSEEKFAELFADPRSQQMQLFGAPLEEGKTAGGRRRSKSAG